MRDGRRGTPGEPLMPPPPPIPSTPPTPSKLAPIRQLVAAGKLDAARAQLARLIQRAPSDSELCAAMATVLGLLSQDEQGRFYASRAIAGAGSDVARLHALAEQFLSDGRAD